MKTSSLLWQYRAEFFWKWEMFQTEVVEKIRTHILYSAAFLFRKSCRLWANVENMVELETSQAMRRMRVACWISMATHAQAHVRAPCTHTYTQKCVILIAFPLQQWSHVRTSVLSYTYIACLVFRIAASLADGSGEFSRRKRRHTPNFELLTLEGNLALVPLLDSLCESKETHVLFARDCPRYTVLDKACL